jgi:hypothetical protein
MSAAADINRLPKRARLKISTMLDAEADAQARLSTTLARIRGLFDAVKLKSGEDSARDEQEEIERLQAIQEQQQRRHLELANINGKVRRFLMELPPHAELVDLLREKVPRVKGETPLDAIKRVRAEIRTAQGDVRKLYHAAPRAADLKRAAKAYVAGLAETGRPKITGTHEKFEITFDNGGFTLKPEIRAILAWFDPDALLRRLEEEIDAMPVPPLTLSAKEKNERLAAAKLKLLTLERQEEALIEAAYDDGEQIVRRYDADPVAILQVLIKRKKAVAA